jgi:hypothetical protein
MPIVLPKNDPRLVAQLPPTFNQLSDAVTAQNNAAPADPYSAGGQGISFERSDPLPTTEQRMAAAQRDIVEERARSQQIVNDQAGGYRSGPAMDPEMARALTVLGQDRGGSQTYVPPADTGMAEVRGPDAASAVVYNSQQRANPANLINDPNLTKTQRGKLTMQQAETQQNLQAFDEIKGTLPPELVVTARKLVERGNGIEDVLGAMDKHVGHAASTKLAREQFAFRQQQAAQSQSNRQGADEAKLRKAIVDASEDGEMALTVMAARQKFYNGDAALLEGDTQFQRSKETLRQAQAARALAEQQLQQHQQPAAVATNPQAAPAAASQQHPQLPIPKRPGSQINAQGAILFLQAAGGNNAVARQMAAANGWTF